LRRWSPAAVMLWWSTSLEMLGLGNVAGCFIKETGVVGYFLVVVGIMRVEWSDSESIAVFWSVIIKVRFVVYECGTLTRANP
jgi:hypothetical protein